MVGLATVHNLGLVLSSASLHWTAPRRRLSRLPRLGADAESGEPESKATPEAEDRRAVSFCACGGAVRETRYSASASCAGADF